MVVMSEVDCSYLLQVKNSLRAVNDRFEDSDDVPPPVRVIVAEGDEDVTIKAGSLLQFPQHHWQICRTANPRWQCSMQCPCLMCL